MKFLFVSADVVEPDYHQASKLQHSLKCHAQLSILLFQCSTLPYNISCEIYSTDFLLVYLDFSFYNEKKFHNLQNLPLQTDFGCLSLGVACMILVVGILKHLAETGKAGLSCHIDIGMVLMQVNILTSKKMSLTSKSMCFFNFQSICSSY